jgi:hypothetical protein
LAEIELGENARVLICTGNIRNASASNKPLPASLHISPQWQHKSAGCPSKRVVAADVVDFL